MKQQNIKINLSDYIHSIAILQVTEAFLKHSRTFMVGLFCEKG